MLFYGLSRYSKILRSISCMESLEVSAKSEHPIYWACVLAGASTATGKLPRLAHKEVSYPHRPCPCCEQR